MDAKLIIRLLLFVVVISFNFQQLDAQLRTQTSYSCEGEAVSIECPDKHRISIMRAVFGRSSLEFCADGYDTNGWDLNCMSDNSLSIVSNQCQGRSKCQISASRAFFGESCTNTVKYLEIEYGCIEGITTPVNEITEEPAEPGPSSLQITDAEKIKSEFSAIKYCPEVVRRQVEWPKSKSGELVYRPCPNNPERSAAWQCGWEPVSWIQRPDLSHCVRNEVIQLDKLINKTEKSSSSLLDVAEEMVVITFKESELYGGDLSHLIDTMRNTIDQIDVVVFNTSEQEEQFTFEVTEAIVKSSSNLLSDRHMESWLDLPVDTQAKALTSLMTNIENSGFKLARAARSAGKKSFNQIEPNIATKVVSLNSLNVATDLTFPDDESLKTNESWLKEGDSLKLSGDSVKGVENTTTHIIFALYKNLSQLLRRNYSKTSSNTTKEENDRINSKVISASIKRNGAEDTKLTSPVVFILRHSQDFNANKAFCSFWNFYGKEDREWWSTSGCKVVSSNLTHTTCSCNHLTSFAILMSIAPNNLPESYHDYSLKIMTYIGCIISIICLLLAFITYFFAGGLNGDRDTIHRHLFITLAVSESIFLYSISPITNSVACLIVAVVLHYMFLVAFIWMGLEGFQLYIMLVEVFNAEKSRALWYYISAYGIPLIITGTTVIVNYNGYEVEKYCWLKIDKGFIWAFVGPVCIILTMNAVMLLIALRAMYLHSLSPSAKWKFKQCGSSGKFRVWIKGAFMLIILLGLTWAFGLMYVNDQSIFMAYLFTIFNSLQGFFIFFFYCLLNEKVVNEYRKLLRHVIGLHVSLVNLLSGSGPKSSSNSISTDKCRSNSQQQNKKKLEKLLPSKKSTSTEGQSSLLPSKINPSAVDNSYRGTDSGYIEEHIYYEPTEDDPSFYLEPIKIKIDLDSGMTFEKKGRIFSLDEDISMIEGSVAYTKYLDDNQNGFDEQCPQETKMYTIDVKKYRIQQQT